MTESMIRGWIERQPTEGGVMTESMIVFWLTEKRRGGGMPVTGRSGRASGASGGTRAACGAFAKKAARVLLLVR